MIHHFNHLKLRYNLIKSRIIILLVFIFLFLCGCVQNVHNNSVSPEKAFLSNHESSADPATMPDNVDSDASSPTDAGDLSELPEKVDTENQNTSLAGSTDPEDAISPSDPNQLTNGQNHDSEESDHSRCTRA